SYRSVEAAGVIVQECLTTHRLVATATGVRPERLKAESRVERARGKAEAVIKSLSGVEAVIESIRCRRRQKLRRSRLCHWQERKTGQHQWKHQQGCCFEFY